jgi:hypothetical protein
MTMIIREYKKVKMAPPFVKAKVHAVKDPGFIFGKPEYVLLEDYVAWWMGWQWTIPAGYVFDGASVPRLLWGVTGYTPFGLHLEGALVHDDLCEQRPWWCSSIDAARAFRYYVLTGGTRESKAQVMYRMVRWFGPRWKRSEAPHLRS